MVRDWNSCLQRHQPLTHSRSFGGVNMSMPLEKKKKHKRNRGPFFLIEGHKLNEITGKLEPYKKKVYWNDHGC